MALLISISKASTKGIGGLGLEAVSAACPLPIDREIDIHLHSLHDSCQSVRNLVPVNSMPKSCLSPCLLWCNMVHNCFVSLWIGTLENQKKINKLEKVEDFYSTIPDMSRDLCGIQKQTDTYTLRAISNAGQCVLISHLVLQIFSYNISLTRCRSHPSLF